MNMLRKLSLVALLLVVVAALVTFTPSALADTTGIIRGTVIDKSGAAVPDATVVIVQKETNYTRTLTSNATGAFEASTLPIGTYSVKVSKASFRTYEEGGIPLAADGVYVVKAQLEVGGLTTTVEVAATLIQTDTTTMQLGSDISGQSVNDLPVLNRDWIQLQQTLPGTVAWIRPLWRLRWR